MTVKGIIKRYLYKNEMTGYSVFLLASQKKTIICCGTIPNLSIYTPVELSGETGLDKKYPDSFCIKKVLSFESDKAGDISYLCNLPDANITHEEAVYITNELKSSVFDTVATTVQLEDFLGNLNIDRKKGTIIFNKTKAVMQSKELFDEIISAEGTYQDAVKINDFYGENALNQIKKHPYKACYILGIKFRVADILGERYGFNSYSNERIESILKYAIDAVIEQGSVYAKIWEIRATCEYVQKNAKMSAVSPYYSLSIIPFMKELYYDGGECVYYKKTKETEDILIQNIKRIADSASERKYDEKITKNIIKNSGIALAEGQKQVFKCLQSEGIKIITGGPGRGKTTIINLLIEYIKQKYPKEEICLMAPTGCAAQKMAEKSNLTAETIHLKLGVRPYNGNLNPVYDSENPMPYKFFIIDEYSMADLELSSMMFAGIPNHATVIIVGDPDQLPSVGAGNVLNDFINSGLFEVYELTDIFRQSEDSVIVDNAENIRKNIIDLKEGPDFIIKSFSTSKETAEECMKYIETQIKQESPFQVLCPIKKHEVGTRHFNIEIQKLTHHEKNICKYYGEYEFYVGDEIITIKNNRDSGYFNGEPGVIQMIDDEGIYIVFKNGDSTYIKNSALNEVLPAKAMTIHKAQGNEYENVILLITQESQNMMSRQILYTAVTRAKKSVVVFLQFDVLKHMREDRTRNSLLSKKLAALL